MMEAEVVVEEKPTHRHADWDRNDRQRRELAIKLTNEKFGTSNGNATLDYYNAEQKLFFAQKFFDDDNITWARITAVKNGSNGFNEFFIEANSDIPRKPIVEHQKMEPSQEIIRCPYCVSKNLLSNVNCTQCGAAL